MTNSKFTPGPWLVVHDGWKPWDGAIEIQAARSARNPYTTIAWTPTAGDEVANARLIASAPELLEALKLAVSNQPKDDSCEAWVSDAKAAIAKAEGRS